MDAVRSMINTVRASTRQRDDFEANVRELAASDAMPQVVHLPTDDTEAHSSSTLHMFNQTFKSCKEMQVTAPGERMTLKTLHS